MSLAAGEKQPVTLDASGQNFTGWSPHAEVGSGGDVGGEHAGGTHN